MLSVFAPQPQLGTVGELLIDCNGQRWTLVKHNDLGVPYFAMCGRGDTYGKTLYICPDLEYMLRQQAKK